MARDPDVCPDASAERCGSLTTVAGAEIVRDSRDPAVRAKDTVCGLLTRVQRVTHGRDALAHGARVSSIADWSAGPRLRLASLAAAADVGMDRGPALAARGSGPASGG